MDPKLSLEPRYADAVRCTVWSMTCNEQKGQPVCGAARRIERVRVSGKDEVDLGAAVRNEDLLTIDADRAVRKLGSAR